MIKWPFFKKKKVEEIKQEEKKIDSEEKNKKEITPEEIFFENLEKLRKGDPLIGAKIGAKYIFNRMLDGMKDEKGVHIQSLLCALGSLAGYSCQASIRSEFIEKNGLEEKEVFNVVKCNDGSTYYFGDNINKPLADGEHSVWSLTAGVAAHLGLKEFIDLGDIFKYVARTVGSSEFGIPRVTEHDRAGDTPINYVKGLWTVFLPMIKKYCATPNEWPILFGLAVQETMLFGKDVIDSKTALSIVMESAVPMSKIDLK